MPMTGSLATWLESIEFGPNAPVPMYGSLPLKPESIEIGFGSIEAECRTLVLELGKPVPVLGVSTLDLKSLILEP